MHKLTFFSGWLLALLFLTSQMTYAQSPVMDTDMVKDGKIYVVVAVLVVIFIGILLFLFRTERRISKLERRENNS
ncbi:MAG: CcmD family protein [Chitinophagaceae bacterium]